MRRSSTARAVAALSVAVLALTACGGDSGFGRKRLNAQSCMERAIYFEANRSSRDGMIAVGHVVMNRVASDQFPDTVCEVVGQKNQFAPGVLSRPIDLDRVPDVRRAASAVLRGERHPRVGNAMFFHTHGHRFPYDNMHYVLVAGGNAFYEKRRSHLVTQPVPPAPIEQGRFR